MIFDESSVNVSFLECFMTTEFQQKIDISF